MTTILAIHATLSLTGAVFNTIFQSAYLHNSLVGLYISSSLLLLAAYLLYRRNKWTFIPALLYLLQRLIGVYAAYALFQSYSASHPGETASVMSWQDPVFWLTAAPIWILPVAMGAIYTGYSLYQRKRGLLA